uniref:ATP synthase F0 subunit 8 n=1 Tax=Sciocoris lateralis TaxID=2984290 RepID=UPI0023D867FF|nr:ATP synthase F0 subunit 8 [Sciocoris lateralis]WCQ78557.1 ATP synthase F0 subunit 8 [Sciocoris lateralis]
MPQMAPLWWELLYITFTITLFIVAILVFYTNNNLNKNTNNMMKKTIKQSNWSW